MDDLITGKYGNVAANKLTVYAYAVAIYLKIRHLTHGNGFEKPFPLSLLRFVSDAHKSAYPTGNKGTPQVKDRSY